jgi:hypothetical protein
MTRFACVLVAALLLAGCEEECACDLESSPAAGLVPLWEPVDVAFAGCQGACGANADGPSSDVMVQPGASIGERTYCPVSGAVFEVAADHPHVDVDGARLFFCCAACAQYFQAHRDQVLRARGIPVASVATTDPP